MLNQSNTNDRKFHDTQKNVIKEQKLIKSKSPYKRK